MIDADLPKRMCSCNRWPLLHEHLHTATYNILGLFLFVVDVYSDVLVMLLLFDTGKIGWASVSCAFLLLQYVVLYVRMLDYMHNTFGTSAWFRFVGPLLLPVLDVCIFLEPARPLLERYISPKPWRLLSAYKATRLVVEVVMESLPQFVLQSSIFVIVMVTGKQGADMYNRFARVVPNSMMISALSILKMCLDVVVESDRRKISVTERVQQLYDLGAGFAVGTPIESLLEAGCTMRELAAAGYTLERLRGGGYTAAHARAEGYTPKALCDVYLVNELYEAGFSLPEIREVGPLGAAIADRILQLRKLDGITCKQAKDAGFLPIERKAVGFTALECREAGDTAEDWRTDVLRVLRYWHGSDICLRLFRLRLPYGWRFTHNEGGVFEIENEYARDQRQRHRRRQNEVAGKLQSRSSEQTSVWENSSVLHWCPVSDVLSELKESGGISCVQAQKEGFSVTEAKFAGFTIRECAQAGFETKLLRDAALDHHKVAFACHHSQQLVYEPMEEYASYREKQAECAIQAAGYQQCAEAWDDYKRWWYPDLLPEQRPDHRGGLLDMLRRVGYTKQEITTLLRDLKAHGLSLTDAWLHSFQLEEMRQAGYDPSALLRDRRALRAAKERLESTDFYASTASPEVVNAEIIRQAHDEGFSLLEIQQAGFTDDEVSHTLGVGLGPRKLSSAVEA